jgi:HEPN domain-containing protein
MPENDKILDVAGEWTEKAENDLKNASYVLKMGDECPTDTVCFHAQQCVEKYLKAALTYNRIDFPRTHDISELIELLPVGIRVGISIEDQLRLNSYAVVTRYPGDFGMIHLPEAKSAVALARRVRKEIKKNLPPAISRRGGKKNEIR